MDTPRLEQDFVIIYIVLPTFSAISIQFVRLFLKHLVPSCEKQRQGKIIILEEEENYEMKSTKGVRPDIVVIAPREVMSEKKLQNCSGISCLY